MAWLTLGRQAQAPRPAPAPAPVYAGAPPPDVKGRACVPCAVTWRSGETACWVCGQAGVDTAEVTVTNDGRVVTQ